MGHHLTPREIAYCGVFGAAAFVLPLLFHLVRLGHVFMPMYLPLVALAFFVRPLPAALTAFVAPLLSGALTQMPPFYPPVAFFMAVELSTMAAGIAAARTRWPRANEWIILVPALLLGRALYVGLVYLFARFVDLPAEFLAGVSLLGGWPGVVLMIITIPPLVRSVQRRAGQSEGGEGGRRS